MPRYILTGTPGAGKTALLRGLEVNGQAVVEEAATDVMALRQSLGDDEPSKDPSFIDAIVGLQRQRESRARAAEADVIYFDRSPICTLALSRYLRFPTSPLLAAEIDRIVQHAVYSATVFFVRNQGSIQATAARRITFEDSLTFEQLHEDTYRQWGFELVEVPAGPLVQRIALVQQTVEQLQRNSSSAQAGLREASGEGS
ncbi:AAA family ATPase [Actinopolymorpha sp. B17G11]|uniref:ATP/GTP-binding protein n=1 Tax=Actinopolymorpha sp. B17G11 TaxID=3160861 RepID=UPI0032E3B515